MKKTSKNDAPVAPAADSVEESKPVLGPEALDAIRLLAIDIATVGKRLGRAFDAPACGQMPRCAATVERGWNGLITVRVEFKLVTLSSSIVSDVWRSDRRDVEAKSEVNWSAIGAVGVVDALAFGALLSELTMRAAVAESTLAAQVSTIDRLMHRAEVEATQLGTKGALTAGFRAVFLSTLANAIQEALKA